MQPSMRRSPDPGAGVTRPAWSLQRWLSVRAYGLVTSALFGAVTPPRTMRARFELLGGVSRARLQGRHPGLAFEDHRAGQVPMESVRAVDGPRRALLHLHGGGFFMGSPASYRNRAMRLSFRLDAEVFLPDYRLAPEHPYPGALEDAMAAFLRVRQLRAGMPVVVSGDSAGGGLALSLLLRLRDTGSPMPEGAILLSPWTDLTASGPSVDGNQGRDRWFTRRHLETWARHYAGDADARSPQLSPAFADLSGLPPLLLLAGEDELLLDDARRVQASATRAGVDARLVVGAGMQHDWPLTLPWLEESRKAWIEMRRFVEEVAQP
jgi:epsilon-lactone hydrolase